MFERSLIGQTIPIPKAPAFAQMPSFNAPVEELHRAIGLNCVCVLTYIHDLCM